MARLQSLHKEILLKKEILDKARTQLKKEFIGIDEVIDEVINNISSWYFFPSLQSKPVIINLWGLTGVGKSSLVKRIAALTSFDEKYYQFDLRASKEREWEIKSQLEDIYENVNGYPIIITLDEFQHARTLDETGKEMDKTVSGVIWELLDSGQFQVTRRSPRVEDVYHLMLRLKSLLAKGVMVKAGMVIARKEYFIKEMNLNKGYQQFILEKEIKSESISFISDEAREVIYSIAKEKFTSPFDVKHQLNKLDGFETIEFLIKMIEFAISPKTVDCSKALIFVVGNLDEAYLMSNNYNTDMDADEFHEQSLKINLTQIKRALRNRFRNEQIARLGNIHIIYPAFNSQSFHKIIKLELGKIQKKVQSQQNIKISFDESIFELIYKEGVYPTQGTRPIFTTIHQVINTKLGRVLTELIINKLNPSRIIFRAEQGDLVTIDYFNRKNLIYSFSEKQILNLEKLRKNRKDDMQAITAVHESGHAIIAITLLKTVPEVIYSVTADTDDSYGFVHTKLKWKYINKEQITKRLAMYLGGYAAEKIIFGEENITTGAEGDISMATNFATTMLKSCGMGSLAASFQVKYFTTNNFIHDESNIMNEEAKTLIQNAFYLAEKTLKEQQALLLKMSDYLSDNRCMNKEMIKEMISKYAESFSENELIENGDLLFYRNHLKEIIKTISNNNNKAFDNFSKLFEISLNKVKDEY